MAKEALLLEETEKDFEQRFADEFRERFKEELAKETFKIDSLERLDWVFSIFGRYTALIQGMKSVKANKVQAAKRVYEAQIWKIEKEYEQSVDGWVNEIKKLNFRFGADIQKFIEECLKIGKSKSIKVAGFQVGYRVDPEKITIKNKEKIKEWALVNCEEACDTEIVVSDKAIKEFWKKTKIVPDGMLYTEAQSKFYAKTIGDNLNIYDLIEEDESGVKNKQSNQNQSEGNELQTGELDGAVSRDSTELQEGSFGDSDGDSP
jgi:hypothetical protein